MKSKAQIELEEIVQERREYWDGDIYGEDQAISVIKKQYAKHTGKQPITAYERLTAKDRQ